MKTDLKVNCGHLANYTIHGLKKLGSYFVGCLFLCGIPPPPPKKKLESMDSFRLCFQENSLPFLEILQADGPSDTSVESKEYFFFKFLLLGSRTLVFAALC